MNDKADTAAIFDPARAGWEIVKAHNFGDTVGPIWQRDEGARLRFGFLAAEKHLNHVAIVHGGMLMSFADQAMGMTAMRATGGKPHVTIELNVQFIGAVRAGDFVEAHCDVTRLTRSLIFMQAKLRVGEHIAAAASGIWKILGRG